MLSRRTFLSLSALAGGMTALSPAVTAQTPIPRPAPADALLDSDTFQPGDYEWHPELSPAGPVAIIVSIPEQRVHVYRNGIEIGVSSCSTGRPGHSTPTGVFVILQKDADHRSSTYNNAPMPNMQRLTWSGIALHAGNLPGYPASHGCIRLPREFSRLIFGITHLGMPVIIADETSDPASVVHPGLLLPVEAEAQARQAVLEASRKAHHDTDADLGSHDVVSMVISGLDRQAVLFLDGVEIWRSAVRIKDPQRPLGNHVYKLLAPKAGDIHFRWLAHPIHVERRGGQSAEAVLSRVEVVEWQGAVEILSEFRPGSTLVVTELTLEDHTRSGPDFVIMRGV